MPTITFHCDRRMPGTSNVPMLAALGVASQGFAVTYVRVEPSGVLVEGMMPDFLEGVDVASGCLVSGGRGEHPHTGGSRDGAEALPLPATAGDFLILDVPLPDVGCGGGFDGDAVVSFVTGSSRLRRLPLPPGARSLHCGYDGVGRGGIRRDWDESLGGRRLLLPGLNAAETASILRGVPLVRARATALELGSELIGQVPDAGCLRRFGWPSSSRRLLAPGSGTARRQP